jgi:hypothetical protein
VIRCQWGGFGTRDYGPEDRPINRSARDVAPRHIDMRRRGRGSQTDESPIDVDNFVGNPVRFVAKPHFLKGWNTLLNL